MKSRTTRPLEIPPASYQLAMRLAILCEHGLWDKAHEELSKAELDWHCERVEQITIDSALAMLPGLDHRAICALENVGVITIRQFRSLYATGHLELMPQVGAVTIRNTIDAIARLPGRLVD